MKGQFRNHTVAALILCAAVTAPCAANDSEPPALVVFTTAGAVHNLSPLTGDGETTLNSLREDPNVSMLRIGHSAPEAVLQATAFSLVPPPPAPGHAVHFRDVERTDHSNGMVSLYARDSGAGSEASIVIDEPDVSGRVRDGQGNTWRLTPLGGGLTAVYRYDASNFRMHPPGWDPGEPPAWDTVPREHTPENTGAGADTGDLIDVMVIYTRAARTKVGNINMFLQEAFDNARRRYENSELPFRLRLVHAQETTYAESGNIGDDLNAITSPIDGKIDSVHALRDQYGADLVHLFIQGTTPSSGGKVTCGVAWLAHLQGLAIYGFGTTAVECEQERSSTFTHEIGHNQGADHDRANTNRAAAFPYGYGTCHPQRRWSTVMAYVGTNNDCSRAIPFFSSPSLRYEGVPTGEANSTDNRRVLLETARIVANHRPSKSTGGGTHHLLPYILAARTPGRQGFVRIVNRSDRAGTVTVTAIDDDGRNAGTETLDLDARGAVHFNSYDLERGNAVKGISGVGDGTRDWRLLVTSELDIQPLAYVRTTDGFVTRMDDVEEKLDGAGNRYTVHIANPGRNQSQRSYLRLINPGNASTQVTIRAHDDNGVQRGPVSLSLPAGHARHVTVNALESGQNLSGRLGTGSGKWRLTVEAPQPIHVMSLLQSSTGHVTNLSSVPAAVTDTVAPPPPPPDDHGDTLATATVVQVPSSTPGSLELDSDVDYFRFDLPETSIFGSLRVQTTGNTDTFGTLFWEGKPIGNDSDSGSDGNFDFFLDTIFLWGTYHVEVSYEWQSTFVPGRPRGTGDYTLQIEYSDPSPISPTSDIELIIKDACDDSEDIQYRLFEYYTYSLERHSRVWPESGLVYVTPGLDQRVRNPLTCTTGRFVCYGGNSRDSQQRNWGVGIEGDGDCTTCCLECHPSVRGNHVWSLRCGGSDSKLLPSEGPAGEVPESFPIRR